MTIDDVLQYQEIEIEQDKDQEEQRLKINNSEIPFPPSPKGPRPPAPPGPRGWNPDPVEKRRREDEKKKSNKNIINYELFVDAIWWDKCMLRRTVYELWNCY